MKPGRWKILAAIALGLTACAVLGGYWLMRQGEQWAPVPPTVAPRETDDTPPPGALVLFDGTNLDQWRNQQDGGAAGWKVAGGVVTVDKSSGNIVTRRSFGNFRLHLEWRVPQEIAGEGQARGNSGVFLAALGAKDAGYEVQILDSWNNPTYVNGQAGAIYKQFPPLANPIRPPGQWNVYDIDWTAPLFDAGGKLRAPARATVLFNGVVVQDNVALKGETRFIGTPTYRAHGSAPIMLQAHGDPSAPISFRNIWLVERR